MGRTISERHHPLSYIILTVFGILGLLFKDQLRHFFENHKTMAINIAVAICLLGLFSMSRDINNHH